MTKSSLLNESANEINITPAADSRSVEQGRKQTTDFIAQMMKRRAETTIGEISRSLREAGRAHLVCFVFEAIENLSAAGTIKVIPSATITRIERGGKEMEKMKTHKKVGFVFPPKDAPSVYYGKTERRTF